MSVSIACVLGERTIGPDALVTAPADVAIPGTIKRDEPAVLIADALRISSCCAEPYSDALDQADCASSICLANASIDADSATLEPVLVGRSPICDLLKGFESGRFGKVGGGGGGRLCCISLSRMGSTPWLRENRRNTAGSSPAISSPLDTLLRFDSDLVTPPAPCGTLGNGPGGFVGEEGDRLSSCSCDGASNLEIIAETLLPAALPPPN